MSSVVGGNEREGHNTDKGRKSHRSPKQAWLIASGDASTHDCQRAPLPTYEQEDSGWPAFEPSGGGDARLATAASLPDDPQDLNT